MFWGRGTRNYRAKRLRCQSAPLSTRLSPERHRQHTPRATRTRTRGGGAAFGVMNSPPRTQRTSSTARRSPGSGARGRYKWMMAAYLWGEILADVCMTSFTFHCCAGLATTDARTGTRRGSEDTLGEGETGYSHHLPGQRLGGGRRAHRISSSSRSARRQHRCVVQPAEQEGSV